MGERRLAQLRRRRVGFVFQSLNLLPSLTAAQNVILPLRLAGEHLAGELARDALAGSGLMTVRGTGPLSSPVGSSSAWRLLERWRLSPR